MEAVVVVRVELWIAIVTTQLGLEFHLRSANVKCAEGAVEADEQKEIFIWL